LSRGRVAVEDGELKVERGSGQFLPRYLSDAAQPLNRLVPEMDVNRNFGAEIL
jgi:dihydropyrimidinase